MKKESGFIQIFVIIIVLVLIALYFGKNPIEIWDKIKPIFIFILDLFVKTIEFIIKGVVSVWDKSH